VERRVSVVDVVVPTIGRPSLGTLLEALAAADGPLPNAIVLVDDRRAARTPLLDRAVPARLAGCVRVVAGPAAGPAAARNVGWRASSAEFVAFVDDDVVPDADWLLRLREDIEALAPDVAASQGRLRVPLPRDRRPSDWERNVAALADAQWATADMVYRRAALAAVGGFDARFPRAYREDADLALRVSDAGWRLTRGRRTAQHPVRPADRWISIRLQRGNADDALMRALHGRDWRARAGVPRGRRPRHLAVTAAATLAVVSLLARRRWLAAAGAATWLAGTAELAWSRIAPGPRTRDEILTMTATSAVLPFAATAYWLAGWARVARLLRQGRRRRPRAVLLDRDGTLVVDVPYNGDPARVRPVPDARAALARLREAGVALAVVSNQSGVARGVLTHAQVVAVNRRIEELLGPLGPWFVCFHGADDGCECRKPRPGMVLGAARALGVAPADCVVIGDTGADVEAARAAGARGVLVPNEVTRREEIARAVEVAPDLMTAVNRLLGATRCAS
jgi:histidinol-phosphate phosphatase family protein